MRKNDRRVLAAAIAACLLTPMGAMGVAAQKSKGALDDLKQGQIVDGFKTVALFLDDAGASMGVRFVHAKSGFTLDVLQIQSVPQGFIWVNSWPTSDMGEPHTQEHLLLGKGNKGRAVSTLDDMSLCTATAYTEQWRTCYHFNTSAGPEVFFNLFEKRVDALLHPDYTDEEVRREVRNFGVSRNADGSLRLEEKGSVYNEMVSSNDNPYARVYNALNVAVYGKEHPLSYDSGGLPEALRILKPDDIRRFHAANYHLGNMGMVGAFPKEMPLDATLRRLDGILSRLEPDAPSRLGTFKSPRDFPAPRSAPAGTIRVVDYPDANAESPSPLLFAWPADLEIDSRERLLASLFVGALAGDQTSNLYKKLVDSTTRETNLGATNVFGYVSEDPGHSVIVGLTDVAPRHLNESEIGGVRTKILDEIARVASWKDGSPELAEFNGRVRALVFQQSRGLSKFVNTPPGFGFRSGGSGSSWINHLNRLVEAGGFRTSVTMKEDLAAVEALLAGGKNFWRDRVAQWKLDRQPLAVAARPSPDALAKDASERKARVEAETASLRTRFGTTDEQETIKRYSEAYDATTAELERAAGSAAPPRFVDSPPLTLDDQLDFHVAMLGNIPVVTSIFDNMTSSTFGLAVRLDTIPQDHLLYLSVLPNLMTDVGVIENGKPVSYEEMSKRLRTEILGLSAYYSSNPKTGRVELVVKGSGNTPEESDRAIEWMKLIAFSPDWRVENLPRIRDVVDQSVVSLSNTMRGPEEYWVNDPADAYWRQNNPLLMATGSFLTLEHNAHRLRWLLRDSGAGADREAIAAFLTELAAAGGSGRTDLQVLLGGFQGDATQRAKIPAALQAHLARFDALPAGAKANATEAVKDLSRYLVGVPDETLARDWKYLGEQMRDDLLVPPSEALATLDGVRKRAMNGNAARVFQIGSGARNLSELLRAKSLTSMLDYRTPATAATYSKDDAIVARLREHAPGASPVFVGLVNPNTQGGVFLNSAPLVSYADVDRESLMRLLAAELYGGGGAHGLFIKTWAAGLAYSNGIGVSISRGRLNYYAERCPELPQTLRFVIDEVKKGSRDPNLVEYAVALAFRGSRSASTYEGRGEAMAADLVDGFTPDVVRKFRTAILNLRTTPKLADALFVRMPEVYARVLPGSGVKAKDVAGGIYFVIGPERQMALYEAYLKSAEGPDANLYRLYPRDFWMVKR